MRLIPHYFYIGFFGIGLLAGCVQDPAKLTAVSPAPEALFTIRAEDNTSIVRAVTKALSCPFIQFDSATAIPMRVRVGADTVVARNDNGQPQMKEAVFDVLTCESEWPASAKKARVNGLEIAAPHAIKRIAIISDTGCRMKASDNGFQSCNDLSQWPFAQVVASAAALKPDLVLHLGDINYRESPCPEGNNGCANSPWGYGFDTWNADLFLPAKPLLTAAPWLFVRGNHESCTRAGQGWFRFIDPQPWSETRSCNRAVNDDVADYSEPYAVELAPAVSFIVFDSSRAPSKALKNTDPAFEKYSAEMQKVAVLVKQKPANFFLSHHPVLGFGLPEKGDKSGGLKRGNAGLQSVMEVTEPKRLLPEGITLAISGHIHLFEALGFSTPHPATLVMGNSGSLNEGKFPEKIPAGTEPYPGAVVEDFVTMADYGFATLDKVDEQSNNHWLLTEYKADGTPMYTCDIFESKAHCKKM